MTLTHVAWKRVDVLGNRDDDGTRSVTITPVDQKEYKSHGRGFSIAAEDAYALATALNQAADYALAKGEPTKIVPVVLTVTNATPDNRPGGINYSPFKSRHSPF
jgi:hypothetical protein